MAISHRNILFWASVMALAAGLIVGLWTLLAPLGIWLGLWEYPTGFQVLLPAMTISGYVALACLLVAAALAILSRVWGVGNLPKLVGFAAAGAIAAGIAWYIPNSFQAPEGESYPPIHDISTDTENPPQFQAVVPIREQAGTTNTVEYGGTEDVTPEELARMQREAYPEIQPVVLDVPPDQAYDRVLAAVEAMGWELVDADPETGRIEATDTTFWFRFKDDIVIRLTGEDGGTRVDARSVSRVGRGDVGTNARRLRNFFEALQS